MKILTKLWLAVALLNMGTVGAAQAPVQEPITNKTQQFRLGGYAFMAGHHPRLGAQSIVNRLPSDVAKDIVKFAKPSKGYGFIKNFTDKQIVFFGFVDAQVPSIIPPKYIIDSKNALASLYKSRFIVEKELPYKHHMIIDERGNQQGWMEGISDRLFDIYMHLQGEPSIIIKNVRFFDLVNLKVFREHLRIRIEVTSQDHDPVSYYSEPI